MAEFNLERVELPSPTEDPFREFREIALLEFQHQFSYRHSLGKTSKFFLGLKEGKLLATRCKTCGSVYMPPRAVCPKDLQATEWFELTGKGTLESWTVCTHAVDYAQSEKPYILAYVSLEGANSLFLHQLRNVELSTLEHGLVVKAVFSKNAIYHPLESFWFELGI